MRTPAGQLYRKIRMLPRNLPPGRIKIRISRRKNQDFTKKKSGFPGTKDPKSGTNTPKIADFRQKIDIFSHFLDKNGDFYSQKKTTKKTTSRKIITKKKKPDSERIAHRISPRRTSAGASFPQLIHISTTKSVVVPPPARPEGCRGRGSGFFLPPSVIAPKKKELYFVFPGTQARL